MKVIFSRHEEQPGHNVCNVEFEYGPDELDESHRRIVRMNEGMKLVPEKFWLTAPIEDIKRMIKEIDENPVIVKSELITVDLDAPKHPNIILLSCSRGMVRLDNSIDIASICTEFDGWFYRIRVDLYSMGPSERELISQMNEGYQPTLIVYSKDDHNKPAAVFRECSMMSRSTRHVCLISNTGVFEKGYESLL